MVRDTVLPVQVSRHQVGRLLATIFALDVAFLVTTAMIYSNVVMRNSWGGWGYVFREALDVGAENNLAPWFSAITLLIAAGVWVICYALELRGRDSTRGRLSWGWLVLAVLFCFLSLDEEGSFHERLAALPGVNRYAVLLVPGAAFGVFLVVFAWPRLRHSWLAVALPAGLAAAGYLVSGLHSLAGWLDPFRVLSAFWWIGTSPLQNGIRGWGALVVGLAAVVALLAGAALVERRDLEVP